MNQNYYFLIAVDFNLFVQLLSPHKHVYEIYFHFQDSSSVILMNKHMQ